MRKQKLTINSIYAAYLNKAYLNDFGANTTDEMMLQTNNYGEIFHNHRNCQEMKTDGICRTIIHEAACF